MIEVIYREDVSEDTIHEPRNVKQIGSVDPKYRIYMEETVLTCIRNRAAAENEVHFGVLLGELKRAAGTTYLFIRGMVKAAGKKEEVYGRQPLEKGTGASAGRHSGAQEHEVLKSKSERKRIEERKSRRDAEERKSEHGTGSGAVALERLSMDRQRRTRSEEERRPLREDKTADGDEEDRWSLREDRPAAENEKDRWSLREDGPAAEDEENRWSLRENSPAAENEKDRRSLQEDGPAAEDEEDRWSLREDKPAAEKSEEERRPLRKDKPAAEDEEDRWALQEDSSLAGSVAEAETAACPLIELDGETWTKLYEDINHYFPNMEILGWYASFPFLNVAEFDLCRQIHCTHFSGADKVLFLCDRTEREENFYRPDGAELRETEGYFVFFEKNDAMLTWQQENEEQVGEKEKMQPDGVRQSGIRQGTVGEAPRKKWNISAASILVTAALLAAVLVLNRYNSRLKTEDLSTAGENGGEGTSGVQLLAVDGEVMDENVGSDGADDGNAGSEGTESEGADGDNTGSDGTDNGSAENGRENSDGDEKNGGTENDGAESENSGGDGADSDGSAGSDGTASGGANSENPGSEGADSDENAGSNGTDSGGEDNSAESDHSSAGDGDAAQNGSNSTEEETVQTGSRVSARYYTVKDGETLYSICMDVYKTSAMVEIIRKLNGIGEDYVIQAGQKIILP